MRRLLLAMISALGCCGSHSAEAPAGIYDRDPEHLWNRLYRAVATRTTDGVEFGSDNSEPYISPVEDLARLNAVLDEFLAGDGRSRFPGDLHQALLLNDVWAAFDLAATRDTDKPLQQKLARAVGRLRMPAAAIAALPDNYAHAVTRGGFAKDFNPAQPDTPFLPADLFDPNGPWVQIDREGYPGLIAPFHVIGLSGRSTFQIFIRCPGGRKATLEYLQALNLYRTPWSVEPAEIARREPTGEPVRWSPLRLNSATPQFPAGTRVALVRRMVVIDERLEPVPTPITQSVQLRVYKKVGGEDSYTLESIGTRQSVHDFVMRRGDLLAGRAGGLHAMARDEREYRQSHDPRVAEIARAREHRVGPVVLATCRRCHQSDGVFSVLSYNQMLDPNRSGNPQLLPAVDPDSQRTSAVQWKKRQFDWGLLRGLLEAQR
jgi:hypothetical protein